MPTSKEKSGKYALELPEIQHGPEEPLHAAPIRGVGFICRKNKDISYTEIDLKPDRLHCVKL